MAQKAVFLDRDGTVIDDVGYLDDLDDIEFLPGALQALRDLQAAGFLLVIVTNQSGVARGFFDEDFVHTTHDHLLKLMEREQVTVAGVYYCPHHSQGTIAPYVRECACRKPAPGMARQAAAELHIDLERSFMVGDHASDIGFGKNAGMRSVFVHTGHGEEEWARRDTWPVRPDHDAPDLAAAADWILKQK